MALIEVRDVSKVYRRDAMEIPVLANVSISVPEGDFLGLMGPSGSGKSTLLNLLAGIDRPTRGTIHVGGADITRLSERALASWRAQNIGFIFQLYNLIPVLSAFENVELPLLLTSLTKKQRREHVLTALNIVGLGDARAALPAPAVRRAGAARRHRPRDRHRPGGAAGGRTDRRSRREVGRRGLDPAAAAQYGIQEDDRAGDARSACGRADAPRAAPGKGHVRRTSRHAVAAN